MKIALIGFGKMGQEIQRLLDQSKEHKIVSISYRSITDKLDIEGISLADVVIDFTSPDIVLTNIQEIISMGKNLVVGTTGWYDHLGEIKALVEKNRTGLIYGQNFSIGANIFFKISAFAASLFAKFSDYDVYGLEIHHKAKKDSPSGTALKISEKIKENYPEGINFASIRSGRNPGFHQVVFDSMADSITLSHQAHGRVGFAKGALMAAEFIKDKKGFYSFDTIFSEQETTK